MDLLGGGWIPALFEEERNNKEIEEDIIQHEELNADEIERFFIELLHSTLGIVALFSTLITFALVLFG